MPVTDIDAGYSECPGESLPHLPQLRAVEGTVRCSSWSGTGTSANAARVVPVTRSASKSLTGASIRDMSSPVSGRKASPTPRAAAENST
ncbi:MAG: hypothetical protein JO362_17190 [Streptomycetaceae bacterium]|nr:hypothetical protein [Streptomycetaceae bacterium]